MQRASNAAVFVKRNTKPARIFRAISKGKERDGRQGERIAVGGSRGGGTGGEEDVEGGPANGGEPAETVDAASFEGTDGVPCRGVRKFPEARRAGAGGAGGLRERTTAARRPAVPRQPRAGDGPGGGLRRSPPLRRPDDVRPVPLGIAQIRP